MLSVFVLSMAHCLLIFFHSIYFPLSSSSSSSSSYRLIIILLLFACLVFTSHPFSISLSLLHSASIVDGQLVQEDAAEAARVAKEERERQAQARRWQRADEWSRRSERSGNAERSGREGRTESRRGGMRGHGRGTGGERVGDARNMTAAVSHSSLNRKKIENTGAIQIDR